MPHELVHTIGCTTYFIFILLFLWSRSIPRTNPGSSWWAASITCALLARLSMLLLQGADESRLALAFYVFFNVLEKPLLLIGLTRFLNIEMRARYFWLPAMAAGLWLVLALAADFTRFQRALGYSLVNAGLLLTAALLIRSRLQHFPGWPLKITLAASALLALHWLAAPFLIYFYPSWGRNAFLLGTSLVLVQYLSLLLAVLALFQTRLLEAEARALEMAYVDPLTGLNNQRYMTSLFEHALVLATRPHQIVAVFYIDLDNFKPINDTAGHAAGDQVLKTMAARMKSVTRSTDICARIGGDEFVVIATQLEDESQASEIARKLLAQMTRFVSVGDKNFQLGASIGISLYPRHGTAIGELVQCADQAMYEVKQNGKSGWKIRGQV